MQKICDKQNVKIFNVHRIILTDFSFVTVSDSVWHEVGGINFNAICLSWEHHADVSQNIKD